MGSLIEATIRLIQAGKRAYTRKWAFLALFVLALLGTVITLGKFDILPQALPASSAASSVAPSEVRLGAIVELPTRIEVKKINVEARIENPLSTDISVLDNGLLAGAVRYPTSAKLGEDGNVVLFGHSSYLPVVRNQAYRTFNGIQKLVAGDTIVVSSNTTAYTYRVRSMTKESANDAVIPLVVAGRILTLSTCDSFGAKTDRFVVVAEFVESHSLSV